MFVNKTKFKRMIKEAYNGSGLTVGMIYEGLVIWSGQWATWTKEGYVPNWVKAAVMEYTGELPERGNVFQAKKEHPLQYEISENKYFDLPTIFQKSKCPFNATPMIYDEGWKQYRFLQNNRTKDIVAVNMALYDVLDMKELEQESHPYGPCAESDEGNVLLWRNENSVLAMRKSQITSENIPAMDLLKQYDFEKGDD